MGNTCSCECDQQNRLERKSEMQVETPADFEKVKAIQAARGMTMSARDMEYLKQNEDKI